MKLSPKEWELLLNCHLRRDESPGMTEARRRQRLEDAALKRRLLAMAARGEPRPAPGSKLGRALARFCVYDPDPEFEFDESDFDVLHALAETDGRHRIADRLALLASYKDAGRIAGREQRPGCENGRTTSRG